MNIDPGQQLFYFPGFITNHLIESPIFINSNNTLIKLDKCEKIFLGENSPYYQEERFLKGISELVKFSTSPITIINSHGFNRGYGKMI